MCIRDSGLTDSRIKTGLIRLGAARFHRARTIVAIKIQSLNGFIDDDDEFCRPTCVDDVRRTTCISAETDRNEDVSAATVKRSGAPLDDSSWRITAAAFARSRNKGNARVQSGDGPQLLAVTCRASSGDVIPANDWRRS